MAGDALPIWLVNAAMYANPIVAVIAGIVALVAIVGLVIYYWDDLKAALMDTAAFKWVMAQLEKLGAWFDSMGGWSGLAKAAWDGIVAIFNKAINSLIEMLNKIPGVNIETRFGDLPAQPEIPQSALPVGIAPIEQIGRAAQLAPSVSPTSAASVPPGGLLSRIQNTNQSQDRRINVDTVEIHTGQAMNPLELENMMSMTIG